MHQLAPEQGAFRMLTELRALETQHVLESRVVGRRSARDVPVEESVARRLLDQVEQLGFERWILVQVRILHERSIPLASPISRLASSARAWTRAGETPSWS